MDARKSLWFDDLSETDVTSACSSAYVLLRKANFADCMHEKIPPKGSAEARATARTNLFVTATLHTEGDAFPVTIRDLSAWGAQIESSLCPGIGAEVTLSRGPLSILGHMTWVKNRRCGLRFASPISVQDWMANPVNRQQQRVDHVVAFLKSGALPPEAPVERPVATRPHAVQDLRRISRLLEILSDALASDPAVVVKHGILVQNLDIALQTLSALAGTLRSDDPEYDANIARLAELRIICAEVLQDYP